MRTFRRYLFSYIVTLMLPSLILSCVIFHIVNQYCSVQILEQNNAALEQLSVSISMQEEQMEAYALQTTQRSEFFPRNLDNNLTTFLELKKSLSQWQMTNRFLDSVFFYTTPLNKVYSYNALFELDWFRQKELPFLTAEELTDLLNCQQARGWLADPSKDNRALFYFSSVRLNSKERNILLCKIDLSTLNSMVDSTLLYSMGTTLLCDAQGKALYYGNSSNLWTTDEIALCLRQSAPSGIMELGGRQTLYVRYPSQNGDIVFISLVPAAIANEPITRLLRLFLGGMGLIIVLGAMIIAVLMRSTYRPIRSLEHYVLDANVLSNPTDDAVDNVRSAFAKMHTSNTFMLQRSEALAKERIILKLLLGDYASPEAFNAEGRTHGLHLGLDCWHVALVTGSALTEDENFAAQIVEAAKQCVSGENPPLYLEVSESHSLIFILDGMPCEDEKSRLLRQFVRWGQKVELKMSAVCTQLHEIAEAYLRLTRDEQTNAPGQEKRVEEFIALYQNALEFGELERIQFALNLFQGLVPGMRDDELLHLCYTVTHMAQSRVEALGDRATREKIDQRLRTYLSSDLHAAAAVNFLCGLSAALGAGAQQSEDLYIQKVEDYLRAHYRDEEFTVQNAAAAFDRSISNLSHYFKSHTGLSISTYVESLRMEAARQLLKQTSVSVSEIAHAVGYAQPATFMRAFKKVCGYSPSAYRENEDEAAL
ncbi:MAG: helix-turn-helix domain-containing protein [Eubacteriales bacterium]|nr:helix-turn-helix domain-containing protein [Eubacteriales bacterium]